MQKTQGVLQNMSLPLCDGSDKYGAPSVRCCVGSGMVSSRGKSALLSTLISFYPIKRELEIVSELILGEFCYPPKEKVICRYFKNWGQRLVYDDYIGWPRKMQNNCEVLQNSSPGRNTELVSKSLATRAGNLPWCCWVERWAEWGDVETVTLKRILCPNLVVLYLGILFRK